MKFIKEKEKLTAEELSSLHEKYVKNNEQTIVRHALSKNKISDICFVSESEKNNDFKFSLEVKTLPICNQKQSGRCWIFAGCNLFREIIAKKLNLDNFELSQNYVAFYDKLEKANYALSSIMELLDREHDDRILSHLLINAVGDGGQFDMFVNLVNKYGLCPKKAMEETFQSSVTRESDLLINATIRNFAFQAQKLFKDKKYEEIQELKNNTIEKIYNFLSSCFGLAPEKFDFEYVDRDGQYHLEKDLTPKSFVKKFLGEEVNNYQSITNSPTKDKPYYLAYTIDYLGNVVEGKKVTHLNLPMERIEELIINQLKDGQIVWFGSDVSYYGDRESGKWDDNAYDYLSAFNMDLKFDKGGMLDYYQSAMNHAMCITGVNLVDGKPTKWKIENSWGDQRGEKGFFIMSEDFFKNFVYQAVVNKKYLNEDEKKALEKELKVFPIYDPMGTLA